MLEVALRRRRESPSLLILFDLFQVDGNLTVDGIEYYVSEEFGDGLYNACKDVKFGSMNTRAIDFIGAGAKSYKGGLVQAIGPFTLLSICFLYTAHTLCSLLQTLQNFTVFDVLSIENSINYSRFRF